MKLFPRDKVAGIFRGFSEGGLEFHADLVLPYRNEFQRSPMHGQFVAVQLETEDEAVLGRVTSVRAEGRLTSDSGENFGIRAISESRPIPEDLREQYLKYKVDIRVLGVVRIERGQFVFAASHRRLPHVGSKVAFLDDALLRETAGHNFPGAELGHLALGEFVYAAGDDRLKPEPWMRILPPAVVPKFEVRHLVSRRSFVFARAGFGKSNLVKLLFSRLYAETPTVPKRGGVRVPVGTIIFDPDGEYFWPDDKNRPGLCDVPALKDRVVVFTRRKGPSAFYQSFVAGDIKLDIRRLRPADVVSIALSPEKQDQQNVRKLKTLNDSSWRMVVDLIHESGNLADETRLRELLHLEAGQEAELNAARANMTAIVKMLHDPGSLLMDMILAALRDGKICVVDVSQLRGAPALVLSGLILRKIFDHNQEQFTQERPSTIPTIAVVEEAQSVLGTSGTSGEGPYVEWVKEGRKYDLGALLVTQQPGSITTEILSQGDNWFVFHLLSSADLVAVKRANAHFSDDLLSSLLNEPIPGHGIYWSSAAGRSYPIPFRALSFEDLYHAQDPSYDRPADATYAVELRERFRQSMEKAAPLAETVSADAPGDGNGAANGDGEPETAHDPEARPVDHIQRLTLSAIAFVRDKTDIPQWLKTRGVPWYKVHQAIVGMLPGTGVMQESERDRLAQLIVPQVIDALAGAGKWGKEYRPSKSKPGRTTCWIVPK